MHSRDHFLDTRLGDEAESHPPAKPVRAVKKTTSQNVWPRINSLIKTARSAVSILRRQPRNVENVTLVARRREHFRVCLAIFLVAQIPPKRGVLVHKKLNVTSTPAGKSGPSAQPEDLEEVQ